MMDGNKILKKQWRNNNKNEAKARELAKCSTCFCAKWCNGIEGDCCDEFEHLLAMAQWKDKQLKDIVAGIIRNLERGAPII